MFKAIYSVFINHVTTKEDDDVFDNYYENNEDSGENEDKLEGVWTFEGYYPENCWKDTYDCSNWRQLLVKTGDHYDKKKYSSVYSLT